MNLYVCMWNVISCDVDDDVDVDDVIVMMYVVYVDGGVMTMLNIPRGGNKVF